MRQSLPLLRLALLVIIGLFAIACKSQSASLSPGTAERIQAKAERAKAGVQEMAESGQNPSEIVRLMKQVKPNMDKGRVSEAEALLDEALEMLDAAQGASAPERPASGRFGQAEKVKLKGYDGDAMEPFISRDGEYLFFNNLNDPHVNTNLHYAKRVNDNTFNYIGKVKGVNTDALEGVPSMDEHGNFYFVSPRSYDESLSTLYQARFKDGAVSDVKLLKGDVSRKKKRFLNMDLEISADGNTLYFVDNEFEPGKNVPKTSNIGVAAKRGDKFMRLPDSNKIMRNINTDELEYAPSISADGKTLYFTRAQGIIAGHSSGGANLRILVATRGSLDEPFGKPELVDTVRGFIEGPTVSSDGKSLYFHKKNAGKFVIYRVAVSG